VKYAPRSAQKYKGSRNIAVMMGRVSHPAFRAGMKTKWFPYRGYKATNVVTRGGRSIRANQIQTYQNRYVRVYQSAPRWRKRKELHKSTRFYVKN